MLTKTLSKSILALLFITAVSVASAQTKYWTGGDGRWNDPAKWSLTPQGAGGAGVPRVQEDVVINGEGAVTIQLQDVAWCRGLLLQAGSGSIRITGGTDSELNIAGDWRAQGSVQWDQQGQVRLVKRQGGAELELRGMPIAADVMLDGSGSWSLLSDLTIADQRALRMRQGTLIGNGNRIKAGRLLLEGRGEKRFIAGSSIVQLQEVPDAALLRGVLQPGSSTLAVQGQVSPWGVPLLQDAEAQRDINVCGTGPGQTPFIVDAQLTTNFNGFGVQCRGACNATVTATVTGGSGNFTYAWLNGGPNTSTWTTACGGPQIVIVTDVVQGISCPAQVNVTEPAPLGIIFFGQGTPPTCATVCDGSRTALAVGGVSPIAYNWNNGAGTSSAFFGLCPGLNTLVITDANGCAFDTTFFFNVQPITPNLSFTPTSCFGSCDGTAEVAPSGGTGNFTINWSPGGATGPSVSNLCPGNYSVTLADVNGCDTTLTFDITEPPPILSTITSTDATCSGTCDGTASVTASGSPGPFSFVWTPEPGSGQGTADVIGLCEGTYSVLVTDQSSGCDTTLTVNIAAPGAIDAQAVLTDASCAGTCDGEIQLTTSGGTPPYTFTWTPAPPAGQGTGSISGLCAGNWSVLIADAAGCDTTLNFTITEPPPIDPGLVVTDVSCAGACDGTATATVTGGVAPYDLIWTPAPAGGQGSNTATGLCAGNYTLLITDDNGCDTTVTFTINEPPPLSAVPSQTNVTCGGLCDGSASVVVSGGVGPYGFVWVPDPPVGQGTAQAEGLCAGTYTVTITDQNGCELAVPFTILDAVPILLSLQLTPASCPGVCDGGAGVIASGGVAPYTYAWTPEPGAGQGSPNVTGLCPQAYSLTVTDAVGCDTTIAFTITAPDPITVAATVVDATCSDDCNGSIDLLVSGGNGTFTYVWTPAPGAGQGTASVTGLCAGPWQVLITSGGCDTTLTYTILEPPPIVASLTTAPPTCSDVCDGTASAIVSGGTLPYDFVWTPAPVAGQGTPDATGLCPGSYSLLITDAAGCDTTITFVIDPVVPIVVDLVLTPTGCSGQCIGTADATVSGGTAPYVYDWSPDPINGDGTPNVTALCSGAYTLTVTDALGCDTTVQFVITTPSGIDAVPTVTDATCGGTCDGTIVLATSGGVAPYSFVWTPEPGAGQGTGSVSGLCAGLWTVQVTDAAGCDTLLTIPVNEPAAIVPNGVSTNETCNGPCDGTAGVAPTGGQVPYQFFWAPVPPNGQGGPTATDLCAGDWSVTITDAAGCDTTVVFTILPNTGISAGLVFADGPCHGECGGTASVTPTGGVEPYTFLWQPDPITGQGTDAVSGLCVGGYSVTVTDALGCDTTLTFIIEKPGPFVPNLVVQPEDCTGPCSGAAAVFPAGATPPYTYLWNPEPGSGQGTNVALGLCAGTTYDVTITDANLCDTTLTITIDPFEPILPNVSSMPVSCSGACDGTATVGPTGGQAPYTFFWVPEPPNGQGVAQATGLCEGIYEVTITDAVNCTTTTQVLITGPAPLSSVPTITPISCNGECDGAIVMNTQGGTAPYGYTWSPVPPNGQGNPEANGLCAGLWSVLVVDAAGCDTTFTFDLVEPTELTLQTQSTPSQCQVCVGTGSVQISGGTAPFIITWTNGLGAVIGNVADLTDLCADLYTVSVEDANGCIAQQAVPVTDSNGEVLTMQDGSVSCPNDCNGTVGVAFTCSDPPCTVAWSDDLGIPLGQTGNTVIDLCPGQYLVTVTNASGCVAIGSASVVAPTAPIIGISSTAVSCAGACDGTAAVGILGGQPPFTFTWSPEPGGGQGTPLATGLCAGVYTILITEGAGCDTSVSVVITEPPVLDLDEVVQQISCSGTCDGSISLLPGGGVAPYTVIWSPVPPAGQGVLTADDLCAGQWTVVLSDANGCSITRTYDLTQPAPLTLTTSSTPSSCLACDGSASVTVTGGVAPYTYGWVLAGTVVSTDPDPIDLCAGLYTLTVTDANGCSTTSLLTIADSDAEVLIPQNGQVGCSSDCDGTAGVFFTCSAPPCVTVWTNANGDVIAQNQLTVPDLCIGTYTVQVTNGAGCVSFATVLVEPSQTIIPNLGTTAATCAGGCDGTATVGPTGGVEPYTYAWTPEPGAGQNTPQATGLCAGVYSVLIADALGCDTTVQVLILEPTPLTVDGAVDSISCSGVCDGSVTIIPQGGVAPYTYNWSPEPVAGQGTPAISLLCAGDYTLTLTDANGCSTVTTWTVSEPQQLLLSGSSTLSNCGACDGTASIGIAGGTAPYFVQWTQGGAVLGTGDTITDRCGGIYIALVTDANGCEASLLVPISDVEGEELTMTDGQTTCPGDCDGTVQLAFTCTDPPCTVVWYDAAGTELAQGLGELVDLCAGDYFVQVTNATGCVTVDTATVASPDPILANLSATPASCSDACDGTATVGPTGGVEPYEFLWAPEPLTGQGTPQAGGLCAGVYTVTITDDAGCSIVQDVIILAPLPISVSATIQEISCNGVCDGSIALVPQGGVAPYTFLWSPAPPNGPTGDTATDLCAGDWQVLVTDANGCDTLLTYTISEPALLEAVLATTDNICFGDCLGTAEVFVQGGTAPFVVVWTDANGTVIAQGQNAIDLLCAGDYTMSLTDANGCTAQQAFTIGQGTPIDAGLVFTGETCFGPCDGTATVNPSGGNGPYTILWQPEPGGGQGSTQATGLCVGNYTVTLTDLLGCDSTYAFTILPFAPIDPGATITPETCSGSCDGSVVLAATGGVGVLTYVWTPEPPNGQGNAQATGLCPGELTVTITDQVGCDTTLTFTITGPPALALVVDQVVEASCANAFDGSIAITASGGTAPLSLDWVGPGGFTSNSEDITGLAPGDYVVTVTDDNGCDLSLPITVGALSTLVAVAGDDQQLCAGPSVVLDGSLSLGALTYQWTNDQGTVLGDVAVLTIPDLAPGTYIFTLTVTDGPCISTDQLTVVILDLPLADAGPDQTIFLGEETTLGGSPSGPEGSIFTWTPDSTLSSATVPDPVADPSLTTWYTLTVVAPNGCIDTDSVLITVLPEFIIPSGFTPNGDGANDTWVIDLIEMFPLCEVEVYSRWGEMLFQSVGYKQPWDGRYNNGPVPVGTYYYVVKLNDPEFPEPYTGPLTVIR